MKVPIATSFFAVLALGLASAAPGLPLRYLPMQTGPVEFSTLERELDEEVATSQNIPPEVVQFLVKLAPKVISGVMQLLRYAVCDSQDSQLQENANNEERNAKIMALVEAMDGLLEVEGKLDGVKRINMRSNLIAEAELFDWVDSVKNKLKNTFSKIGAATKKLLCNNI